jgi:hypothetical protein
MDLTGLNKNISISYKLKKKKLKSHYIGNDLIAKLIPFRNVMRYQLQKRGYSVKYLSFKDLVSLYYNEFVSVNGNSESYLQPVNCYEFRNNVLFKLKRNDNINGNFDLHRNLKHFDSIGGVVDNIIQIFKTAKLKKRYAILQGMNPKEQLTDEELIQANAAERIEKDLENKALESKTIKFGDVKNLIIWSVIILIFWQLFK